MSADRRKTAVLAALVLLIAVVALGRLDLFLDAFHTTLRQMRRGPAVQAKLLGEIALFCGFLLLTLRTIPSRVRPRRDAAIFLFAFALGWLAEAWGTRLGLWRYYTREAPPLWVVPGWSLGALIFDRVSERARERFSANVGEGARRAFYLCFAAAALAATLWMAAPALSHPASWLVLAGLSAAFALRAEPSRDFWVLATGMIYVFFADFWGTTNNCWRYHVQIKGSLPSLLSGVLFGMLFDSAVILGALKLARAAAPSETE